MVEIFFGNFAGRDIVTISGSLPKERSSSTGCDANWKQQ
jgi:hypothetical protein